MTPEDILRLHPELSEEEATEVAEVVNKYLHQMVVIKNAEFAFTPEGRRRDSGAMSRLHKSVVALNNETKGDN